MFSKLGISFENLAGGIFTYFSCSMFVGLTPREGCETVDFLNTNVLQNLTAMPFSLHKGG